MESSQAIDIVVAGHGCAGIFSRYKQTSGNRLITTVPSNTIIVTFNDFGTESAGTDSIKFMKLLKKTDNDLYEYILNPNNIRTNLERTGESYRSPTYFNRLRTGIISKFNPISNINIYTEGMKYNSGYIDVISKSSVRGVYNIDDTIPQQTKKFYNMYPDIKVKDNDYLSILLEKLFSKHEPGKFYRYFISKCSLVENRTPCVNIMAFINPVKLSSFKVKSSSGIVTAFNGTKPLDKILTNDNSINSIIQHTLDIILKKDPARIKQCSVLQQSYWCSIDSSNEKLIRAYKTPQENTVKLSLHTMLDIIIQSKSTIQEIRNDKEKYYPRGSDTTYQDIAANIFGPIEECINFVLVEYNKKISSLEKIPTTNFFTSSDCDILNKLYNSLTANILWTNNNIALINLQEHTKLDKIIEIYYTLIKHKLNRNQSDNYLKNNYVTVNIIFLKVWLLWNIISIVGINNLNLNNVFNIFLLDNNDYCGNVKTSNVKSINDEYRQYILKSLLKDEEFFKDEKKRKFIILIITLLRNCESTNTEIGDVPVNSTKKPKLEGGTKRYYLTK